MAKKGKPKKPQHKGTFWHEDLFTAEDAQLIDEKTGVALQPDHLKKLNQAANVLVNSKKSPREYPPAETKELVKRIHETTAKLMGLLEDLENHSRNIENEIILGDIEYEQLSNLWLNSL
jgi:hypothetical protein